MKYSLLDLVQIILSSMDSDEVNSINDTTESNQVAIIVRTVYNDIVSRANLPEHYTLFELEPGGVSLPAVMYLPSDVHELVWLKYDARQESADPADLQGVDYVSLPEFVRRMHALDPSDVDVDTATLTIGDDSFDLVFRSDRAPTYYTSYNDRTLLFDAYNSALETNLQKSKTLAYGEKITTFTMSDSFTPDLDDKQFTLLLNEAKALAWAELKQTQHARAERSAQRGWVSLQRTKHAVDKRNRHTKDLPNYGRK